MKIAIILFLALGTGSRAGEDEAIRADLAKSNDPALIQEWLCKMKQCLRVTKKIKGAVSKHQTVSTRERALLDYVVKHENFSTSIAILEKKYRQNDGSDWSEKNCTKKVSTYAQEKSGKMIFCGLE